LRKDIKRLVDDYINLVVKATMEVAGEILIKIITKKFFHFVEMNNIEFKNERERMELERYFRRQYIKKLGGK
jgi:hypothetical protein